MSGQRHRALAVEDEHEAASDLVRLLGECGCDTTVVTNLQDARRQLADTPPCLILLDLEIRGEPESLRTSEEHGRAFLADVGRANNGAGPGGRGVLVVVHSAYADDPEVAVELMYDGANYVLQKLASWRQKRDRLLRLLEKAGRTTHTQCSPNAAPGAPSAATLSIPGVRGDGRARVTLGLKEASLPPGPLEVLLQLIKAHLAGTRQWPAKTKASPQEHRAVSRLRELLAPLGSDASKPLVETFRGQGYRLREDITIGAVDAGELRGLDAARVTTLGNEIAHLLQRMPKSDGG